MKRAVVGVVVVVLLLAAVLALWLGGGGEASTAPAPAAAAPAVADDDAAAQPSDRAPPRETRPLEPAAPTDDATQLVPPRPIDGVPAFPRGRVLVDDTSRSQPAGGDTAGTAGALDKEAVKKGVAAATPKIKACYEQALKIQPELAGRVVVEFKIEGNTDGGGEVTSGEIVDSEVASPFFEACVLKEVAGTSFDAPSGGGAVTVRYPFRFASTDEERPNTTP